MQGIFNYFQYKFLKWAIWQNSRTVSKDPYYWAYRFFSALIFVNLITILLFLKSILKLPIGVFIFGSIIFIIINIINTSQYLNNDRAKVLEQKLSIINRNT